MSSKSWKCYTEITNILFPESMGELITNTDYLEYEQVPDSGQVKNNGSTCSLVQHLQSLVTCPVCLGTIRAVPVLCCPSGHVTCSACRSQLSSCPVCRAAYPRLELVSHIAAGIIDQINIGIAWGGTVPRAVIMHRAYELQGHQRLSLRVGSNIIQVPYFVISGGIQYLCHKKNGKNSMLCILCIELYSFYVKKNPIVPTPFFLGKNSRGTCHIA